MLLPLQSNLGVGLFMNEIFKIRELGVCKKGRLDEKTAFTYHEMKSGDEVRNFDLPFNFIIFVMNGQLEIQCNQHENCRIQSGQMILLIRKSSVHVKTLKETAMYVMYFDRLISSCDQYMLNFQLPDVDKIINEFKAVTIPKPVIRFLKEIRYFQHQKVDCLHYNSLKQQELFILLRHFCSREDFSKLMAPVVGSSFEFRNKVLDKFSQLGAGNMTAFAGLVGMGRKSFDKKFRREFGIPPGKWILQEKAKRLYMSLTESETTIADAMDRFNFNSAAHFNRFCLQHFSKTPGMIIKEARTTNTDIR